MVGTRAGGSGQLGSPQRAAMLGLALQNRLSQPLNCEFPLAASLHCSALVCAVGAQALAVRGCFQVGVPGAGEEVSRRG